MRPVLRLVVGALALFGTVVPASAEVVRFSNGRTMTVESCTFEGDVVILRLKGGGQIRAEKSLVAEILPDEIPFARAMAIEARDQSPAAKAKQPNVGQIYRMVDELAAKHGVPLRLAHAVVKSESNYSPLAVSSKGAMGLMQLMPVLVRQYRVDDPFAARDNLDAGLKHLKYLLSRFDTTRALAAYNAGEGAVARYNGVPPYRETQEYVRRILAMARVR